MFIFRNTINQMIQLTSVTPKFRINLLKILQGFGTSIVLQISGRLGELSVGDIDIIYV